ncbi:MAG: hypothetical protein IT279_09025 [Ignavibacteriaceae bacterium]|nr:hypothetical protein [Ignavibacteriaceae bacterium]
MEMIKNIFKNKYSLSVFLLLSLVITLFPPFSWGDERLSTESERKEFFGDKIAMDVLPIKQYDFILSNSKREFPLGWDWEWNWKSDSGKSVLVTASLSRHLILGELIINYLLAFIVSSIVYLLTNKISYRPRNE